MRMNMLLGVFSERDSVENAITDLKDMGFDAKDISIIVKDTVVGNQVATNTGASVSNDVASGATTGGVIGALAGLLVGIGAITIPGIGALFIAGPIAAALGLTGAAASTVSGALTGALAGGLIGALVNLGVPENEAQAYEEKIRAGAIFVAVPVMSEKEDRARAILERNSAEQIRTVPIPEDREKYYDERRHIAV